MQDKIKLSLIIPDDSIGLRLDQALSKLLPQFSRTQIQTWIKNKEILINHFAPKSKMVVIGGENIEIFGTIKTQANWESQPIPLDIIYEDEAIIVINKPVGLVVHPGAGNQNQTLLNALIHHSKNLQKLPRAGIIHRLDKNTSGLLVVAKTTQAINHLTSQLKARTVIRVYQAVVNGVLTSGGVINLPIGRHPIQRKKMAIMDNGKPAITHYRVMERYRAHTRIKIKLETGRTHQIRVHMAHIHHALLGDPVYGGRLQLPKGATPTLIAKLREFKHQALHACELGIIHPLTEEQIHWKVELPKNMQELIDCLREDFSTEVSNYDE